jgi:hypothetical protein
LREILADERNLWPVNTHDFDEEKRPAKRHAALAALVEGQSVKAPVKKGTWTEGRDDGTLWLGPAALQAETRDATVVAAFYTSRLDPKTVARIRQFARAADDRGEGEDQSEAIGIAEHIRSDGFAELGSRVAKTNLTPGSWESNPLASASSLVETVADQTGLAVNAAALLLQVLALPEPTKAKVSLWNGWTSAQYDTAAAELRKSGLVVQATVPGAGRKIFGTGKIVKQTRLNMAIEWSKITGKFVTHGSHVKHLITEPCHSLFARAWEQNNG